jgi:hypothetical protein
MFLAQIIDKCNLVDMSAFIEQYLSLPHFIGNIERYKKRIQVKEVAVVNKAVSLRFTVHNHRMSLLIPSYLSSGRGDVSF